MSKSVIYTLYSVKKCLIDSLSVLFEVRFKHAMEKRIGGSQTRERTWALLEQRASEDYLQFNELFMQRALGVGKPGKWDRELAVQS